VASGIFSGGATPPRTAAIAGGGSFRVNVLAEDQQEVCAAFASRTGDRFATGDWEFAAGEPPRPAGAAAWIDCSVEADFPPVAHPA
ncbi:flavin reductase family protein, partial [Streptomyces sp. PGLac3x]